jgi:phage host-nuclease inhibitor protein Gam
MKPPVDIPTPNPPDPNVPGIGDLCELQKAIHSIAQDTLVIEAAETRLQSEVEAMKKAFEEATREHKERRAQLVAAVEHYCDANKDTLFPIKGGKRRKTYHILQHELQYREATELAHEEGTSFDQAALDLVEMSRLAQDPETQQQIANCVKVKPPTLDKRSVRNAFTAIGEILTKVGLKLQTTEAFKINLNFTPSDS